MSCNPELELVQSPKAFRDVLTLVDSQIGVLARRKDLRGDDVDEFRSHVYAALVSNNYKVLRCCLKGTNRRAYFNKVVVNLYHDLFYRGPGRWRKSRPAKRMGDLAVRMEGLVYREGWSVKEAVELLLETSEDPKPKAKDLYRIFSELPSRTGRNFVNAEDVVLADRADPETKCLQGYQVERLEKAQVVLVQALSQLPFEQRQLVTLHFLEGKTLASVSRAINRPQKPLYRTLNRTLKELRGELERAGFNAEDVRALTA